MFAQYAYGPNRLGYCGPAQPAILRDGSEDDVRAAARKFSGAWPYLQVLSRMTGIDDPLDHRPVESYWLGGGVGAQLDPDESARELLAVIGPAAGRYWSHLTPEPAREAAADHCFHVFGGYPWSRLLGKGRDEHPLRILDGCRITWGAVLSRDDDSDGDDVQVEVECRRLTRDGHGLGLSITSPSIGAGCAAGWITLKSAPWKPAHSVNWRPPIAVSTPRSTHDPVNTPMSGRRPPASHPPDTNRLPHGLR